MLIIKYIFLRKRLRRLKSRYLFWIYTRQYPSKIFIKRALFDKKFTLDIKADKFSINISKATFRDFCTIRIRKDGHLIIGENVFFNSLCSVNCMSHIEIGNNTLFGENVKLYDHNHRFRDKDKLLSQQDYALGKIIIGSRCWFGSNVVILRNVTIGDNVVVGANCVISEDIPSNTIVKSTSDNLIRISY